MPRKVEHWLYSAYKNLTQERLYTESEAIAELQHLWPSLPVLQIVRAEGDLSRTLADVIAMPAPANTQGSGTQQGQGSGTAHQQSQQGAPSFNDLIRQRAGYATPAATLTDADILNAGGRGPMNGQQGEPAPDFIRARYVEKYS